MSEFETKQLHEMTLDELIKYRENLKECEEGFTRVLAKMEIDFWGNLIMLKNGYWFVASGINRVYEYAGEKWIEFDIDGQFDDNFLQLDDNKNVGKFNFRKTAIKVSEISFVGEFDS